MLLIDGFEETTSSDGPVDVVDKRVKVFFVSLPFFRSFEVVETA